MSTFKKKSTILIHGFALSGTLGLAMVSGQNPRIILYGLTFSLLFRFVTVWMLSQRANSTGTLPAISRFFIHQPGPGEKSKPYRDPKTRKLAGLFNYIVGVFTMMIMIGVLQLLGTGTAFLDANVLVPETAWGLLIALIYWADDLLSRNIAIAPGETTPRNLGYNVSGFNFLLAAIAISNLILLIALQFTFIPGFENAWRGGLPIEWIVLSVLALLRFFHDIRRPETYYRSGRRLPG